MNTKENLTPIDAALARSHAYSSFSRLFMEGLTSQLAAFLRKMPGMATAVPALVAADEAAADHYQLFQRDVFPFESFFLQTSGLLGGPGSDAVQKRYETIGFQPATGDTNPDHIALEMEALAFLTGAEADAWQDGADAAARRMQYQQLLLLQNHLLRWAFPFCLALQRQEISVYAAAAHLLSSLLSDHYQALRKAHIVPPPEFTLPAPPDLLGRQETGLRDIAAFLIKPAFSGIYLTHREISRLARSLELPRGFGSREQTLLNLMRTAVQYNALPALLQELTAILQIWEDAYAQLEVNPAIAPFVQPWLEATAHSRELAQNMLIHAEAVTAD